MGGRWLGVLLVLMLEGIQKGGGWQQGQRGVEWVKVLMALPMVRLTTVKLLLQLVAMMLHAVAVMLHVAMILHAAVVVLHAAVVMLHVELQSSLVVLRSTRSHVEWGTT